MLFDIFVLGVVEGVTEFLPISSTGHLLLFEKILEFNDVASTFTVAIQLGAATAVMWVYRRDLASRTIGLFKRTKSSVQFWRNLIVATIPAGIVGLLIDSYMDRFSIPAVIATALILGGVAILWVEKRYKHQKHAAQKQVDQLSVKQSFQVGLYQILALVPGVSRSGATIMGGLLSGLDRVTATMFSFYLSLPILILAGVLKLTKNWDSISTIQGGYSSLIIGTLTSFVVAMLVIRWLLAYIGGHSFKGFAYYRIIAGVIVLVVLAIR